MKKFSYALEFYKERLFDLDKTEIFKNKVMEAENVEKYFNEKIPNIEFIRNYIILSFRMRDKLSIEDRINYVKGLIYLEDYIDFDDIKALISDFESLKNAEDYSNEKITYWSSTGYSEELNNSDFIEKDVNEFNNSDSNEEILFQELTDLFKNNTYTTDVSMTEYLSKMTEENEEVSDEEENEKEEIYAIDENVSYISVEDKLDIYLEKFPVYVNNLINKKLEENKIEEHDIKMIKIAMEDRFNELTGYIKDLIQINKNESDYNNKNLSYFI